MHWEENSTLTVEQCLQFDALQQATVVGGFRGLSRLVQFAHVVEEPDIEAWIRPGLAILTTGHPLRDESIQQKWFYQLNAYHAACVIIARGRYLDAIPESMIAQAEDYAIPIIEIPWDVPFVTITSAIHQRLVNDHVKDWAHLTQWQTQLTHTALTARSLDELMAKFSAITHARVQITPRHKQTSGPSFVIPQDDLGEMKLSVQIDNRPSPYSDQFVDQLGRHMATVTSLFLLREQMRRQRTRDARSRFIGQFLRSSLEMADITWEDVGPWPFDLDHAFFLIVISPGRKPPDSLISHIQDILWHAFDPLHGFITYVPMHNTWVVVIDSHAVIRQIHTQFQTIGGQFPELRAIISQPVAVSRFASTYEHLRRLLIHATPGSLIAANTLIYPDIIARLPVDSMERLVDTTWNKVKNPDLRQTLLIWLQEGGHTPSILKRLPIHRNTLRNRLVRIQKLLGISLTTTTAQYLRLAWDWQEINDSPVERHPP